MKNLFTVTAILEYMNANKLWLYIPFLIPNDEIPLKYLWMSFIGLFDDEPNKRFTNAWGCYEAVKETSEDEWSLDSTTLLNYYFQGVLENYRQENLPAASVNNIQKENLYYVGRMFRIIRAAEKMLWEIVMRGKFYAFNQTLSFEKLLQNLKELPQARTEFKNSFEPYTKLNLLIERYGSYQTKQEYNELIKELKVWIHNDKSMLREVF
jgi:hypothetical protein